VTVGGTAAYDGESGLPSLVTAALDLARSLHFDCSCLPAQGRLLQTLVKGRPGSRCGETGTGCGVGLAWMASAADAETSMGSLDSVRVYWLEHPDLFSSEVLSHR
jgi:predicted O-methyltransferase YrrM